ncbi:MCM DNA helicase complex subunit [Rhizophlyctis rosea]|uniref:MCM DNA helicase complex subunit n=1 Tax=Rhizophlyctis rosea TaxID=64517 RepID=A0AAD5SDM2_9FUNG|nr:MCM DNA helicase complex subunit [Rhizophlyctis rosea]
MEQQSISTAKAGIVTSLQARCSVIAAANPTRGKYNQQLPLGQNVELTEPILSRFDVLCVVLDRADPIEDETLEQFVVESQMRSHPHYGEVDEIVRGTGAGARRVDKVDKDIISHDLLRKYIMYARDKICPRIDSIDQDMLEKLYGDLRREQVGECMRITVRYLESVIRMSEAFARMHLRDTVRQDDVDHAILNFSKYLAPITGEHERAHKILQDLVKEHVRGFVLSHGAVPGKCVVEREELDLRCHDYGILDIKAYLESDLFKAAFEYKKNKGQIILTLPH